MIVVAIVHAASSFHQLFCFIVSDAEVVRNVHYGIKAFEGPHHTDTSHLYRNSKENRILNCHFGTWVVKTEHRNEYHQVSKVEQKQQQRTMTIEQIKCS